MLDELKKGNEGDIWKCVTFIAAAVYQGAGGEKMGCQERGSELHLNLNQPET